MEDVNSQKAAWFRCPNKGSRVALHWCMLCYSNARCRGSYPGHLRYRKRVLEVALPEVDLIMKRPTPRQEANVSADTGPDETWNKRYPTLTRYLVDVSWEDGSAREPSALSITIRDGVVQLACNDKDLKQSLYTSAGSVAEALTLMEKALAAGVDAWRPWKGGKRK